MVTPTNRIERVIDGKHLAFTNIRDAIRFGEGEVQKASAAKKEPEQGQAKSEKSVTLTTPEGNVTLSESQLQQLLDQLQKEEGELCFTELAGELEVMEEKPAQEAKSAALTSAPPARAEAAKALASKGLKVKGFIRKGAPKKDKKALAEKRVIKAAKKKEKILAADPAEKKRPAVNRMAAGPNAATQENGAQPKERETDLDRTTARTPGMVKDEYVAGATAVGMQSFRTRSVSAGPAGREPAAAEAGYKKPAPARTQEAGKETARAEAAPAAGTIIRNAEQAGKDTVIRNTAPAGKETFLRDTEPSGKEVPAGAGEGRTVQESTRYREPAWKESHTVKAAGSTQTPVQRDSKEPAAVSSPKRQDGVSRPAGAQAESRYSREEGPSGWKAAVKAEEEKAAAERVRSKKTSEITTAEKNGYVKRSLNDAEMRARGMAAARRVMIAAAVLSLNTGRDTSFVNEDGRKLVFKKEMVPDEAGKEQPVVKGYIDGQEVNDRQATDFLDDTMRMMPPVQLASMQRIVETALRRQQMGLSINREDLKAGRTAERAVKAHAGGSATVR